MISGMVRGIPGRDMQVLKGSLIGQNMVNTDPRMTKVAPTGFAFYPSLPC